jgi:hypothetical protein
MTCTAIPRSPIGHKWLTPAVHVCNYAVVVLHISCGNELQPTEIGTCSKVACTYLHSHSPPTSWYSTGTSKCPGHFQSCLVERGMMPQFCGGLGGPASPARCLLLCCLPPKLGAWEGQPARHSATMQCRYPSWRPGRASQPGTLPPAVVHANQAGGLLLATSTHLPICSGHFCCLWPRLLPLAMSTASGHVCCLWPRLLPLATPAAFRHVCTSVYLHSVLCYAYISYYY